MRPDNGRQDLSSSLADIPEKLAQPFIVTNICIFVTGQLGAVPFRRRTFRRRFLIFFFSNNEEKTMKWTIP